MNGGAVEQVALLLLVAAVVALAARRLHLPYTTGLVVTGIALAAVPYAPRLAMTRELVFGALLPPLIFEASLFLPWRLLRRDLPVIVALATLGLILAAAATALGMWWLAGWPFLAAALFGVLISATDPVSVIALFREAGVKGRLRILVEAESLFNDGTAAVLFALVVATYQGAGPTAAQAIAALALSVGASLACGALVALPLTWLSSRSADHLLDILLSTVAAYASFLLAEHLHGSGVLATLTAGLIVGQRGTAGMVAPRGREAVVAFWEAIAFVANSLVFLLIGIHEAEQDFSSVARDIAIAIGLVTLGRALAVYPLAALFGATRWKVAASHQHVLFWGGLRGALALALSLGLPEGFPEREHIVTITFAVVTFSLIAQGLTIGPLLRRLRLLKTGAVAPPMAADAEE
jgi:CPA1 family monovalent cation:H+ antiporter